MSRLTPEARHAYALLSVAAERQAPALRRKIERVLRAQAHVIADQIAAGSTVEHAMEHYQAAFRTQLIEAKGDAALRGAVAGHGIAGGLLGKRAMLDGLEAKALGILNIDFGADALAANHLRANVGAWVEKTSKIETRTTAKLFGQMYARAMQGFRDPDGNLMIINPRTIADLVLAEGLAGTPARADLMTITTLNWGYNEGAQQLYKSEGLTRKEWLVTEDDALCEICAPMDGQIVEIDGLFAAGAEDGGLDCEHPPRHPRCRCCLLPVLE